MSQLHKLSSRNWVEKGLLPLVVLLAEAFWFYPWLVWLGKLPVSSESRVSLSLISIIVLLGGAFLATQFFMRRRWRQVWVQVAVVTLGIVVIFIILRVNYVAGYGVFSDEWFGYISKNLLGLFSRGYFTYLQPVVVAVVASVYLWWRGIWWGRGTLSFEDIYRAFVTGAVALVVLGVFWVLGSAYGELGNMLAEVGIWVAGFFFFGLLSLALGNFQVIRQKMVGIEKKSLFSRRWLVLLFSITVVIVLISAGLAILFSADAAVVLGHWLDITGDGLLRVLHYVLVPVGYLVDWLVQVGRYLVRLLRHSSGNVVDNITDNNTADNITGLEPGGAMPEISPVVLLALKWVALALILTAIIYLLAWAVKKARPSKHDEEVEEVSESLWSWGLFRSDLYLFLEGLRRWFARKPRPPVAISPESVVHEEDEVIPDYPDVRAIYRRLLVEGAGTGFPRRTWETPAEYARRLEKVVSDGKEELRYITELYQRVRYGDATTPTGILEQANRFFRGLYQKLKTLRERISL